MHLAISTCDRSPSYLDQTLTSLFEADPLAAACEVRLVVSGPDPAYIDGWLDRDNIRAQPVPPNRWKDVRERDGKRRVSLNFLRVLLGDGVIDRGDGPIVALQDDLAFASRWLARTQAIAAAIAEHEPEFVLALYASYRFYATRSGYAHYPPQRFYGNQALYLTGGVRTSLTRAFVRAEAAGRLGPDDMMLKEWLLETGTPLYAAMPNLCQHIGEKSAIASQGFHQSPTFR